MMLEIQVLLPNAKAFASKEVFEWRGVWNLAILQLHIPF
jgi:hypothetical protein